MLIGVDHGNKQIKTVHGEPFVSGPVSYTHLYTGLISTGMKLSAWRALA